MLLYTAHAKDGYPEGRYSTADRSGLSAYLGYRPMFCTLLEPTSLVDSWFRIASASPRFVEVVDVYDVEESEVIPSDVVEWVNLGFDKREWPMERGVISRLLQPGDTLSTDWLLKPDREPDLSFDVWDVVCKRVDTMCLDAETASALRITVDRMLGMLDRIDVYGTDGSRLDKDRITLETYYRFLTSSGFVPFVWSQVCGKKVPMSLIGMEPEWLARNSSFEQYQSLIATWDNTMGEIDTFGRPAFDRMHSAFTAATNLLANKVAEDSAHQAGVGRNDACFCGSGRKFKKCCARKGLDELIGL